MGIHDGHRMNMRRKYLEGDTDLLEDHELLEILLYYAIPRRDTNGVAHLLLSRYGSLTAVFRAPVADLMEVPGMGMSAALMLKLAWDIGCRARRTASKEMILNSTEKAGRYLMERLEDEPTEVIYQLCLDRKGKVLACRRLGEGGVGNAEVNLRKLVEIALTTSASGVVLAHNHPSGIALPSSEDYEATRQMARALQTIGVQLLDHIIVADGDFVSMADSGVLMQS